MARGTLVVTTAAFRIARARTQKRRRRCAAVSVRPTIDCSEPGLPLLRLPRGLGRIGRVATEPVMVVIAAKARCVLAASAHAFDAEGLLVALPADRQCDEIVASAGERRAGATEPAAATTAE